MSSYTLNPLAGINWVPGLTWIFHGAIWAGGAIGTSFQSPVPMVMLVFSMAFAMKAFFSPKKEEVVKKKKGKKGKKK